MRKLVCLIFINFFCLSVGANELFVNQQDLPTVYLNQASNSKKSLLYQKIQKYFEDHYQEIAARKLKAIEQGKKLNVWGGLNHLGINYTHKFADFSVEYRRDLAPDLFDDKKWIVTDSMDIIIDASTLLGHLEELQLVEVTEDLFAAFVGIKFKRSFKHIHYANSYEEGVAHNLDRLFFSFLNFKSDNFLRLNPYEVLTKEDSLAFNAGALVNVQVPNSPLSVEGGAFGEYQRLSKLQLQAVGPEDQGENGEYLRLTYEKSKMVGAQAHLAVYADFFRLLKLSILTFDFEYKLEQAHQINLSFTKRDLDIVNSDIDVKQQIRNIIKNDYPDINLVSPYLVSEVRRRNEIMNSKYRLLLVGKAREKRTQFIQAAKDGVVKTFYKHYFEVEKFTKSFGSQVLSSILEALFQIESIVADVWAENKSLSMEYQSERDLIASRQKIRIDSEDVLNISMATKLYAYSFKGGTGKKYKKKVLNALADYSGVDPLVYDGLEDGLIEAPLRATIYYKIHPEGLLRFSMLDVADVYHIIDDICRSARAKNFFISCRHPLQSAYETYYEGLHYDAYHYGLYKACGNLYRERYPDRNDSRHEQLYLEACIKLNSKTKTPIEQAYVPVRDVRKFLQVFQEKSVTKRDLYSLFGIRNVFIHGNIKATQSNGFPFNSNFEEGTESTKSLVEQFLEE